MQGDTIIYIMIGICLLVILLFVFSTPLKLLYKIIINSVLGILALIGINFIISPLGLSVGVNLLTIAIIGVLGIPGFICLYLMQILL